MKCSVWTYGQDAQTHQTDSGFYPDTLGLVEIVGIRGTRWDLGAVPQWGSAESKSKNFGQLQ